MIQRKKNMVVIFFYGVFLLNNFSLLCSSDSNDKNNKKKIQSKNVKMSVARDVLHMMEKLINLVNNISNISQKEHYKAEINTFIGKIMSGVAENNLVDEQAIVDYIFPQLLILIKKVEQYFAVPFTRNDHNVAFNSLKITNKFIQEYIIACYNSCEEFFEKYKQSQIIIAEQNEHVKAASACVDITMTLASAIKSSLGYRMMNLGLQKTLYSKLVGSGKYKSETMKLSQEIMALLEEITMTMQSILSEIETFNFEANDFSKFVANISKVCLLCLGTISFLLKNNFSCVPSDQRLIAEEAKALFQQYSKNIVTTGLSAQNPFYMSIIKKKSYRSLRVVINIAESLSEENLHYDKPLYTKIYKKIYSAYSAFFGEDGNKSFLSSIGISGAINLSLLTFLTFFLNSKNRDKQFRIDVKAIRDEKDRNVVKEKSFLERKLPFLICTDDEKMAQYQKEDGFWWKFYSVTNALIKPVGNKNFNPTTSSPAITGEFIYGMFTAFVKMFNGTQQGTKLSIEEFLKELAVESSFAYNHPLFTEITVATAMLTGMNFLYGSVDEKAKISDKISKIFSSVNKVLLNDNSKDDESEQHAGPGQEKRFSPINLDSPAFADLRATGELEWFFRVLKRIESPFSDTEKDFGRSVLVQGPSGCGKTFLVNSFAQSVLEIKGTKVNVIELQPHKFFNRKGNDKGQQAPSLFDMINGYIEHLKLQEKAIIILYLDEFHLFFSGENGTEIDAPRVAEFLTLFNNIQTKQTDTYGLYIICSTNKPELIPHEFFDNPQRIRHRVTITYPNHATRINLMKHFLKEKSIQTKNIDLEYLSMILEGNDVSQGWIREAMMRAVYTAKSAHQTLSTNHIYMGINSSIRKIVFSNRPPTDEFLESISNYQAAAATIALLFEYINSHIQFDAVTVYPILPRIEPLPMETIHKRPLKRSFYYGDIFTMNTLNSSELFSYTETIAKVAISLAGREYSVFKSGAPISRATTLRDKERAIDLALGYLIGFKNTFSETGFKKDLCSEALSEQGVPFYSQAENMLNDAQRTLREVFKSKNFENAHAIIREHLKKSYFVNKKTLLQERPEFMAYIEALAQECKSALDELMNREKYQPGAVSSLPSRGGESSTKINEIKKKKIDE